MTEQLTFFLPTVPAGVIPAKAPPVKKAFPKLARECGECGRPVKGKGFQRGDLCSHCRVVRALPPETRRRICCGQCARGECYAIPY